MRRLVLAFLVAAFAFASGLLFSEEVEAGGGGPAPGQDQYGQDQYSQDQYGQDQYGQDQYGQDQYSQDQYSQDQYSQDQYAQDQYGQERYAGGQFAIDQFYDALSPFGDWVNHPGHGYVWLPRSVATDWRPFTVGNWLHTEEYGWYWQSYEPFAWAVYHYGRWGFDPEYGWYWVPGDTWAPAWVQWRYGNEYVGWAPEAPIPHGGYAYGGVQSYAPPPARDAWIFVEPRYLASPAVRSYALPRTSISIAFSRATYVNRPVYRDGYVYNYGMPRKHWSKVTGRYIEPRRVHRGHYKTRPKGWRGRGHRDVYVYAPRVKKGVRPHRAPKKIAHKPSRNKAWSKNAKAQTAKRNRAAGFVPPRSLGPRGVLNPNYRGPSAGGGRHPLANYETLSPRKAPHARPGAPKPQHAKHKGAKPNSAKSHDVRRNPGANRNPGARNGPRRPSGPRGVASPSDRGPAAGGGRHPLARYDALGPRRTPQARPLQAKPKQAKPKGVQPRVEKPKVAKSTAAKSKIAKSKAAKSKAAKSMAAKSKAARSKRNTSKGAKNGSAKNGSAKNGPAKNGPAKTKSAKTPSRARAMGLAPTGSRPGLRDYGGRRPAAYTATRRPNASAPRTASKPKKKANASKGPRPKQASARAGKSKQAGKPKQASRPKQARSATARARPAQAKASRAKQGSAEGGARRQSKGQGRAGGKGQGGKGQGRNGGKRRG